MAPVNSSPYRLLVEGKDDEHSIINLLKRQGFDWDGPGLIPFVHDARGVDSLLGALPVALKSHRRLGIVVDADLVLADRWNRVRNILVAAGLDVPQQPDPDGTVISCSGPASLERVGIWLMPDNKSAGTLEDFLARLVPTGDSCWPHAQKSTSDARALHGAPLEARDHAKGVIHAWLAWQKDPGQPFGTAITARVLGSNSSETETFIAWFRRVFQS
jgi:hypothetical protein